MLDYVLVWKDKVLDFYIPMYYVQILNIFDIFWIDWMMNWRRFLSFQFGMETLLYGIEREKKKSCTN